MLLSNGGGLGRSLSYVGRSGIRLFMMLHGSVVHKLPFAAASEAFAWNHRAKVDFQSYPAGLAWNSRAKVASRALACNSQAFWSMLGAIKSVWSLWCMQLGCTSCLAKLFLKLLHGTVVQKLPSKLFLKRLFGTVAQTLSCDEAVSQGRMSISIPGRCSVFLSNGRGLGRSLSYVGRSQISLSMMLRGSVVHKSPLAQLLVKLSHGSVLQKLPLKGTSQVWHAPVAQKLPCKAIS